MNSSTGLFLPAAGWREGDKGSGTTATIYTDGTAGYYWSSDLKGNSTYGLYILKNDVFVDTNGNRKSGVSVRCVHNLQRVCQMKSEASKPDTLKNGLSGPAQTPILQDIQ